MLLLRIDDTCMCDIQAPELLIRCWSQLKERAEAVEGLEFYFSGVSRTNRNRESNRDLLVKKTIKKVISDLPSPEQHFIFECLKDKNSQDHGLGEASGLRTLISKCEELFSSWSVIPRRFLRRSNRHLIMAIPAPASAPVALSPNYAPMPSYQVPSPSPMPLPPSPVLRPPSKAPEPFRPTPSGTNSHSPPPKIRPQPKNNRPSTSKSPLPPGNEQIEKKYLIAAISVGALAGLALLALLLLCVVNSKKTKVGPRNGQGNGIRDEKPLLTVCSSDMSAGKLFSSRGAFVISNTHFISIVISFSCAGSSQNSLRIGNSGSKVPQNSSAVGNGAVIHNSLQAGGQPTEATDVASGNTHASLQLPPPPGRSAPPPPGPPPPPPPKPPAPSPPPPPKAVRPPNPPKPGNKLRPSPLGPNHQGRSKDDGTELSGDSDAPKAKLKPFFWEKVSANPDHSMVWHDIKAGSFQ